MKKTWVRNLVVVTMCFTSLLTIRLRAEPFDPAAADYTGNPGVKIYVSKLGDNSDGSSWQKAFHTIQAALLAIPDNQGGHQVLIRPDTYVEANLYTGRPGASGSYNLIMGDRDGKLGSGATGWVVLDSSCPGVAVRKDLDQVKQFPDYPPGWKIIESDLPESGFKCCDYWGPVLCRPDYSTDDWDRWIWRNIYSTGSEAGFGWSMTNHQEAMKISGMMEDCVGIGRFSGACVAHCTARPDEPVVFRRCYFACLDWWGDAGGVYVTARETSMPDYPNAVFEDCTIVSPDNALQMSPIFTWYTRVKFKNCRLISLNFSQPCGTPGSGIICCDIDGKYLHVDLEDCFLMGYKVFGGPGSPSYTLKGKVQTYVQYEQPTPEGFERLGLWPVEVFSRIAPPSK